MTRIKKLKYISLIYFFIFHFFGYGDGIYRFAEQYWRNINETENLIIRGEVFEKKISKALGIITFTTKREIDLGFYQNIRVYLKSIEGKVVNLGCIGKKIGETKFYPTTGINLINDGKVHSYSFMLRFGDLDNPIFDLTKNIEIQVMGVSEESNADLDRVEFIPYEKNKIRQVTIGGVCMDVLWGEKIEQKVKIGERGKLIFYTGIYNPELGGFKMKKDVNWKTDGVFFFLDIVSDSVQKRIYSGELRPSINNEDRTWKKHEIGLSEYGGKEVSFIFLMDKIGNDIGDFGVWGNPILIDESVRNKNEKIPIFIISCDTLRPDHTLPYGYSLPTTPNLDNFSKDSVVFENAYTTKTFTPVAHMSLLSGLSPANHGLDQHTDAYGHIKLLGEILRDNGYQTAGFTGFLWWFMPSRGFARGMDKFSLPLESDDRWEFRKSVFEVFGEAKKWIHDNLNWPIFVFMHNYDIHHLLYGDLIYDAIEEEYKVFSQGFERPEIYVEIEDKDINTLFNCLNQGYITLKEKELSYLNATYDDCVYKVDCALGDFFSFLKRNGLYESSFIAVVSDHGESLGEHDMYGHNNVYEECARTVCIVKFPSNKYAGNRVKNRVILEDIFPTVLKVINCETNIQLDGTPLFNIMGNGEIENRIIFSTNIRGSRRSLIRGPYKLLEDIPLGLRMLFDLRTSMAEYYDISSKEQKVFRELENIFMDYLNLKKEGWFFYFLNPYSFLTSFVKVQCSVPILFTRIQGGILSASNDRTSPNEFNADIFLPISSTPAVVQIVPTKDRCDLVLYIKTSSSNLQFPVTYNGEKKQDEIRFYFSSDEVKESGEIKPLLEGKGTFFWVEYYPIMDIDKRKRVEITDDAKEVLKNLGYLE